MKAHEAAALLGASVDSLMYVCLRENSYKTDFKTTSVHGCSWVLAAMLRVQWLGLNGSSAQRLFSFCTQGLTFSWLVSEEDLILLQKLSTSLWSLVLIKKLLDD